MLSEEFLGASYCIFWLTVEDSKTEKETEWDFFHQLFMIAQSTYWKRRILNP